MKRIIRTRFTRTLSVAFFLNTLLCGSVLADYTLTAPPRENPQDGQKIYGPLAKHLTELLGKKVAYEHPGDWKTYEKKMKKDKYDIVFDGPHFAAWRIDTAQAKPLVKLPGNLRFVLVAKADRPELKRSEDLLGEKICTLPPPNLGAMALYAMFSNPMRQPKYVLLNKGGFTNVAAQFEAGKCDAAILREKFYKKKLDDKIRRHMRVIQTKELLTNQGITVSKRINNADRKAIVSSLTHGAGSRAVKPVLERFSSKAFLPASDKDYQGLNLLKDNMIFGW